MSKLMILHALKFLNLGFACHCRKQKIIFPFLYWTKKNHLSHKSEVLIVASFHIKTRPFNCRKTKLTTNARTLLNCKCRYWLLFRVWWKLVLIFSLFDSTFDLTPCEAHKKVAHVWKKFTWFIARNIESYS
jgi:hypothetical protein